MAFMEQKNVVFLQRIRLLTERETTTKKVKIYETREFKSTCLNFCSVYSATNHEQLCLHCFKGILTVWNFICFVQAIQECLFLIQLVLSFASKSLQILQNNPCNFVCSNFPISKTQQSEQRRKLDSYIS